VSSRRTYIPKTEFKNLSIGIGCRKRKKKMKCFIQLCIVFSLCQCCFSNNGTTELKGRIYGMPSSILQNINQAIQDGNFSCEKKVLFSRNFFELNDKRLLILVGIPDYFCASNSFMPVTVDDQGKWRAGSIIPGEPSWMLLGPDNALWLAAQWQIEGTFPALYRSMNGVDWNEIKLPENRDVDCCFERLDQICFQQGIIRLKFASAVTGKTACWEAEVDGLAGLGPVWKQIGNTWDGDQETPCPFVPLGQGAWIRKESNKAGGIIFKKSSRYSKISVVIPNALE
jgi:hypothetical protein